MSNLLMILGVLFLALLVAVPLLERFAKPMDEQKAGQYSKIMMFLMTLAILASAIKYFMFS